VAWGRAGTETNRKKGVAAVYDLDCGKSLPGPPGWWLTGPGGDLTSCGWIWTNSNRGWIDYQRLGVQNCIMDQPKSSVPKYNPTINMPRINVPQPPAFRSKR